jgi:aspartyl-tRNA synthetase
MRDPNRIQELMLLLTWIWSDHPDMRFNQLLHHLQSEFATKNNKGFRNVWEREDLFGKITLIPVRQLDLFYVEDDEFIKFLEEYSSKK